MSSHFNRLIQERLIGHNTRWLYAARGCEDQFWLGIINTLCQFSRCKSPKYNRMNGTNARTSQHTYDSRWHHWHIKYDTVTIANTMCCNHTSTACHLILQFAIGNGALAIGNRAIIDNRILIASALNHMTVNGIITAINCAIWKPVIKRGVCVIQNSFWLIHPDHIFSCLLPKPLRVFVCLCGHFIKSLSHYCTLHHLSYC